MDIHYFLQKTKIRTWIILPFLFLSITGLGFVFAHAVSGFNFEIPLIVRIGYIISASFLLLNIGVIIWSDNKMSRSNLF